MNEKLSCVEIQTIRTSQTFKTVTAHVYDLSSPLLFNYFTPARSLRAVYWKRALVYKNPCAKRFYWTGGIAGGGKVIEQLQ